MLFKVKIISCESYLYDWHEYENRNVFFPITSDWEEVDENEKQEIEEAIRYANSLQSKKKYYLIEYYDGIKTEVFEKASQFKKQLNKRKQDEEKRKAEAKLKKEASALNRKKKQLEKLKRELGDV